MPRARADAGAGERPQPRADRPRQGPLRPLQPRDLPQRAARRVSGRRTLEDKHLSALIGAAELVRKGCTAGYDMFAEFPLPTVEGVEAVARAYSDAGMRAVIAPMMADKSLYEAIPGLADALPRAAAQPGAEGAVRAVQGVACCRRGNQQALEIDATPSSSRSARPSRTTAPTSSSSRAATSRRSSASACRCTWRNRGCRRWWRRRSMARAWSRISHELKLLNEKFCVAHGVWLDDDDRKRLADAGCSISHNPGSNLKLGSGIADMRAMLDARPERRDRHRRRRLVRQPERVRGDAARVLRLARQGQSARALGQRARGALCRHRGRREGARLRQARPHREGLEGRPRAARPLGAALHPAQRPRRARSCSPRTAPASRA